MADLADPMEDLEEYFKMKNLRKTAIAGLAALALMGSAGNARADDRKIDVLTSSARDYVETKGKSLRDYDMKGIYSISRTNEKDNCQKALRKKGNEYPYFSGSDVSPSTEVIVDYKSNSSVTTSGGLILMIDNVMTECSGTALIPKKKEPQRGFPE